MAVLPQPAPAIIPAGPCDHIQESEYVNVITKIGGRDHIQVYEYDCGPYIHISE